MATPVVYPSDKQFLGWAKETTQGTAVTPITFTQPVDKFDPEDKPTWLDENTLSGSMSRLRGRTQGPLHSEWSMEGPCFFDGIGYLLNNIMGDLVDSGATPNVHTFSLLNSGVGQPGSLTFVDWQGPPSATNFARVYAGACLSELTIKGNAESSLIMMSAKGLAYPSAVASAAPTAAPSAVAPLAAWRTLLGLAGVASGGTQVKTVREWEVTIKRQLRAQWTLQGTQAPFIIYRGDLDVEGKLTFSVPADESNTMLYLLNNTQPQLQLVVDNGLTLGNNLNLQIDSQLAAYNTTKINRGEEAVGYDVTFNSIINSTNAGASGGLSPVKITLKNAVAAATY